MIKVGDVDVTENYVVTNTPGKLTITPITDEVTVTITGKSDTTKYDGAEHAVNGFQSSFSNPLYKATDFRFSGTSAAARTDAGTTNMGLAASQFANDSDNFTNVVFNVTDGYQEITQRTVTLTSADDEKVYDGTALTNHKVTVGGDGWASGEGAAYDVTGTQTDAGNSPNAFTYQRNANTKAGNYIITEIPGTLMITPITDEVTVTITGNHDSALYDGTAHAVNGFLSSFSNPLYKATDFRFSGTSAAARTDAGTTNMGLAASQFANDSDNFTNVVFNVTDGYQEITQRTVTLTSAGAARAYNGFALTSPNVAVTGDGWANGEGATYAFTGALLNVGNVWNEFTYKLNDGTNAGNYAITVARGILTVNPRAVILTSATTNKVYDGTALTDHTVRVTGAGFVAGEGATYAVQGTQLNAGTSDNVFTYQLNANTIATNYTITTATGLLMVTPAAVSIQAGSGTWVYDGQTHSVTDYTVTGLVGTDAVTATVAGSIVDVGSAATKISGYTFTKGDANNYRVTMLDGLLTIEEVINRDETPLANGAAWALINLILAILTVIGSLILLIGLIGKKKDEDEDGTPEQIKKKKGWRWSSLIPAIGAVIAFILTENMHNPMAWVDKWTILMVIIAVVQIVVMILSKKKKEDDESDGSETKA